MLASKVALITGAAQGIGLATTRLLLQNGAKVSMVDLLEKLGRESCSELQKEFSTKDVQFLQADVTNKEQLTAVFEETKAAFGGIDIVLNNAGIGDEVNWRKTIDVNLIAVIEGTYLGLHHMSPDNGGRGGTVINVASFGGLVPMSFAPTYSASKHGVVGFSRSMTWCSDTVRVNCICPEFVKTRMVTDVQMDDNTNNFITAKGLIEPEEVAKGVLELIQDTSAVGKVMTVTKAKGRRFIHLLGEPKPKL